MNWKMKALVQNTVAALPDRLAQPVYYRIQKKFGDPASDIGPRYRSAARMGAWARRYHQGMDGASVLETGTGRAIDVPIACYLMGAGKIVSVDLNHYLRPELIRQSLRYLAARRDEIIQLFSDSAEPAGFAKRLEKVLTLDPSADALPEAVMALINLEYRPGSDARNLPFPDASFDYAVSLNVFEHIPESVLRAILVEEKRLLGEHGAMIHFIDPSDHFAHTDSSISEINFLRYSDRQWRRLGGNRFMYHNRLRASDYRALFAGLGLRLVHKDERLDFRCLSELRQGFPLAPRFAGYREKDIAITQLHVLLKPGPEITWQ